MKPTKEVKKALDKWTKTISFVKPFSEWENDKKGRCMMPKKEIEDLAQHIWDTAYVQGLKKQEKIVDGLMKERGNTWRQARTQTAKEIFEELEHHNFVAYTPKGNISMKFSRTYQKLKKKYLK